MDTTRTQIFCIKSAVSDKIQHDMLPVFKYLGIICNGCDRK